MKKTSQTKQFSDPNRQKIENDKQELRKSKKQWNSAVTAFKKNIKSDKKQKDINAFKHELNVLKEVLNGKVSGKPRIKLYQPFPEEIKKDISESVKSISNVEKKDPRASGASQIASKALEIVNQQEEYSKEYNKFYEDLENRRQERNNRKQAFTSVSVLYSEAVSPIQMFLEEKKLFKGKEQSFATEVLRALYNIDDQYSSLEKRILSIRKPSHVSEAINKLRNIKADLIALESGGLLPTPMPLMESSLDVPSEEEREPESVGTEIEVTDEGAIPQKRLSSKEREALDNYRKKFNIMKNFYNELERIKNSGEVGSERFNEDSIRFKYENFAITIAKLEDEINKDPVNLFYIGEVVKALYSIKTDLFNSLKIHLPGELRRKQPEPPSKKTKTASSEETKISKEMAKYLEQAGHQREMAEAEGATSTTFDPNVSDTLVTSLGKGVRNISMDVPFLRYRHKGNLRKIYHFIRGNIRPILSELMDSIYLSKAIDDSLSREIFNSLDKIEDFNSKLQDKLDGLELKLMTEDPKDSEERRDKVMRAIERIRDRERAKKIQGLLSSKRELV